MVAYQHPAGLNPFQRYRQAGNFLRHTSRATNSAWYANPLELPYQLHLRADGTRWDSWIFDRRSGKWTAGPSFHDGFSTDLSLVEPFAAEIIRLAKKANASSIGILFHLADEFATAELKPELDNPAALAELRQTIQSDPKAVLDDSSLSPDDYCWRLIPYPATGAESIATAISITKRWDPFIAALRNYGDEQNFPLVIRTLGAPLETLLALPQLLTQPIGQALLAVLCYPRFTVLSFFNEHGDLRLIRTLQHRSSRRVSNLRHAAATAAASMEIAAPTVVVLPMTGEIDSSIIPDLQSVFQSSPVETIHWDQTPFRHPLDGTQGVEPVIASGIPHAFDSPLAASHTFSILEAEGWATQDFLPVGREIAESIPTRSEMRLLRTAKYARFGFAILTFLALCWFTLGVVDLIRRPEWAFNEKDAKSIKSRINMMATERNRMAHWDNLLDDRSKAWVSMEMLARLFPEGSGALIKSFRHTASPDGKPGQAKAGIVKEWKITGLAREDALNRLQILNSREGITAVFAEVAQITGSPAFKTDLPTRSVIVNARTQENSSYRPGPAEEAVDGDESSYPFSFDLTITQRFESEDPMALSTSKAP